MASNSDAIEYEAVRFARRLLGVPTHATQKDIRVAFARRAKVVHPDRFDPVAQKEEWAEANVLLRELNEAYRLAAAVAERQEKAASATTSPAFTTPPPTPAGRKTYAPTPQRSHRPYRESEFQRGGPIGFFDIGIFLVAGIFQFFGGSNGMLLFLAIFFGVDFWMRWKSGMGTGDLRLHMLLPRKGLSFVCMPMWIATIMFGVFGWIFPWQELGPIAGKVGIATMAALALIAASFWYVDYSYEISRPD